MKNGEEKIERGSEGVAKERVEKQREVPQEESARREEAGVSDEASDKGEKKDRKGNGGAVRVGERVRNAARQELSAARTAARDEIRAAKTAAKDEIAAAKQEVADVKQAFSRDGIKKAISDDVAKADLGIGNGGRGGDDANGEKEGKPVEDGTAPTEGQPDDGKTPAAGVQDSEPGQADAESAESGDTKEEAVDVQGQDKGQADATGAPADGGKEGAPDGQAGGGDGGDSTDGQADGVPDSGAGVPAAGVATVNPPVVSAPPSSAGVPVPGGQNPSAGVNANFAGVAGDGAGANQSGVSSKIMQGYKNTDENTASYEGETKTLTDTARDWLDRSDAKLRGYASADAAAKEKYGLEPKEDIAERLYETKLAELREKNPDADTGALERKARRMAKREAEREYETRKNDIYKQLAPDYKSDREYRREQNIKAIISGLGDFGRMAAQAVTAKNAGTILPFKSLTQGAINDRRISDRERKALVATYEQMRQGKLNEAKQMMADEEKKQLEMLKSPASYDKSKTAASNKKYEEANAGREDEAKKEVKAFKGSSGENVGRQLRSLGKLGNNEYVLQGRYKNGYPVGEFVVSASSVTPAVERLYDSYMNLVGGDSDKGAEIKNLWVKLRDIQKGISGSTDEKTKASYQKKLIEITDTMLKDLEVMDDDGARTALDNYERFLYGLNLPYVLYGQQEQGGTASVSDVFGSGQGSDDSGIDVNNF